VKNKNTYYYLFLLVVPVVFIAWFFINQQEQKPIRTLAYFGPKHALKIPPIIK
jgi:hypothetical protein